MMKNCSTCSKLFKEDEYFIEVIPYVYMCKNCYDGTIRNNMKCSVCKKYYPSREFVWINGEEEAVCPICYRNEYHLYPADYKPNPIFEKELEREHVTHIGAELEIQGTKYKYFIEEMDNTFKNHEFYLKDDCSLEEDYGVEIVSQPMLMYNAINKWQIVFDLLNKYNMNDTCDCGLHFHLDRISLNERQIRNMDYIVNNFVNSIFKWGGRNIDGHEYATSIHKDITEWGHRTFRDDKFNAFNFCSNTIELRCFDSTFNFNRFKDIMIRVYAFVEYTNIHKFDYFANMTDSDFWNKFSNYVTKFKNKYLLS